MSSLENKEIDKEILVCAKNLVQALEGGHVDSANMLIDRIASIKGVSLFQELGKLTRDFHEALNSFRADENLVSLAEEEIPNAKERLYYVINKTEEAANKTLNAVEDAMPLCDAIEEKSCGLNTTWDRFTRRELSAQEFRELSREIAGFLTGTSEDVMKVRSKLNDILIAQDFQDITGQIIRKVIVLVESVEANLVNLVRMGGDSRTHFNPKNKVAEREQEGKLEGPQIPGKELDGAVKNQDEVDDLLSSLGF